MFMFAMTLSMAIDDGDVQCYVEADDNGCENYGDDDGFFDTASSSFLNYFLKNPPILSVVDFFSSAIGG